MREKGRGGAGRVTLQGRNLTNITSASDKVPVNSLSHADSGHPWEDVMEMALHLCGLRSGEKHQTSSNRGVSYSLPDRTPQNCEKLPQWKEPKEMGQLSVT